MTVLDIVILVIFIIAAILGFRKGFIVQVGSLAAIVIGIVACRMFGSQVVVLISPSQQEIAEGANGCPSYLYTIVSYCVIYLVAYYAVILVVKLLKLVVHTVLLGPLDRIGGAIVSVIKWFIPVSLLLNLYISLNPGCDLTEKVHLAAGQPVTWIVDLAPTLFGALTHLTEFAK